MQPSLIKFISNSAKGYRKNLSLIFILSVCWASREILTPCYLSYLIDQFSLHKGNFELLSNQVSSLFFKIVILWILMEVCMRLQGYVALKTFPLIKMSIREKVFEQIKHFPPAFFSKKMPGEINDRLAAISRGVSSLLSILFLSFVPIGSYIVFSLFFLYKINFQIAFLFSAWVLIHFTITKVMTTKSLNYSKEFSQSKSSLYGKTLEIIENILLVQTHLRQIFEKQNLKTAQINKVKAEQKTQKYLERMRLFLGLSSIILLMLTLSSSFLKWKSYSITNGELIFIVTLLLNLTGYLWYLSMEMVRLFEEVGIIKEAIEFLSQFSIPTIRTKEEVLKDFSIAVRQVSFSFSKENSLFNGLDFSIPYKEAVAITGISGTGKTTLINLLLKHYDYNSGEILIGAKPLRDIDSATIRGHISVGYQNPMLFNRSIRENICYSKLNATLEEVQTASRFALCHQFIESLPNGYETLIGDKGCRLSGGQKQRLVIARALLKKAPILILDEPTSALDSETESKLMENLIQICRGCTLIVISHRPSTLKFFNRVIKL